MCHVHKTEKFRYPIIDIILKRGKELVKTELVSNTSWESPLLFPDYASTSRHSLHSF